MLYKEVLVFTLLTLKVIICHNDSDESRPYEFGFTIDGQQHRHEKKDQNGIIQGEFGFITADGVYHVTVYATDENGNFKILSMRNIRISAPLDGSPALGPISPEASKYLKKPNQIEQTANKPVTEQFQKLQQAPIETITTQKPTNKYAFTTQSTIRPACAGCGLVTTSKPEQKFKFQNAQFSNIPKGAIITNEQLSTGKTLNSFNKNLPDNPNLESLTYSNQNTQDEKKSNDDLLGNIEPSYSRESSPRDNKQITNIGPSYSKESSPRDNGQTANIGPSYPRDSSPKNNEQTTKIGSSYSKETSSRDNGQTANIGPSYPKESFPRNNEQSTSIGSSYSRDSSPRDNGQTVNIGPSYPKESSLRNNEQTTNIGSSYSRESSSRDNGQTANIGPSYPRESTPRNDEQTKNIGSSYSRESSPIDNGQTANIGPLYSRESYPRDKEETTKNIYDSVTPGAIENIEQINGNQERKDKYINQDKFGRLRAPDFGTGPNPLLQPDDLSNVPPVIVRDNVIHVMGSKPLQIPIKDKYPGMKDGLPEGITPKDVTKILYKFKYTVGFHGHYEKGLEDGTKIGGYFVNGRDGISRVVTYVADKNGYRPKFKFINLGLDSPDTPNEQTEKTFGLKDFEFVWYPI